MMKTYFWLVSVAKVKRHRLLKSAYQEVGVMAGVKSAEIVWRGETLLIAQAWTWSYHTVNCVN
jgi:hypothetical protein